MKNILKLTIGLAMMLMLASGFTKPTDTEAKIESELKEEGWTDILIQPTEDEKYEFGCESLPEFGKTIYVKGTLSYDDGIEPIEMTAYGVDNEGLIRVIGTWSKDEDWQYTEYGEEHLRSVRENIK